MTYLLALIVMIALAGVIALISFTNIGSSFSDRNAKGEAQKIMNTSAEIQASFEAYRAINGHTNFEDYNALLTALTVESNLLRDRIITDFDGHFNALNFSGVETNGTLIITNNDERVCQYINHQMHNIPLDTEIQSCSVSNLTCCEN